MNKHRGLLLAFSFLLCASLVAQTQRRANYIPYSDAQHILEKLAEVLPPELKGKSPNELKTAWPSWVAQRDRGIRTRLTQGDEDSIINFLLFGTSFTRQPRITKKEIILIQQRNRPSSALPADEVSKSEAKLQVRINDLIRGLSVPGNNERLLFARQLIVWQKGYEPRTVSGREQIRKYILSNLERVLSEQSSYQKALEEARLLGDPSEEFYERSRLYRNRGLSLDTSLLPNFALEEALKTMKARGLLKEGSVHRIAIVGPGLDFIDKQEGYDFYPQQSIQPFALIDSLARLRLSAGDLQVETMDLSPRVNDHLARARQRTKANQGYVINLPRNVQAQWKADAVRYWEQFGDQIAAPATPVAIPGGVGDVKIRAVRVKPTIASKVTPMDLNIVLQRTELPMSERFDLMIATNILVYYDTFEQSLAMANVERMLRPGGFLITNNVLLELPSSRLQSVDYLTVVYSDRPDDGDHIVWYELKRD